MNVFFYNLGIHLYKIAILLAYPFHKKARQWMDGRSDYFAVLQRKIYKNNSPLIWFHAASLGEFEQCRPLIEKIKAELPGYGIILTFFSPSGYEIRKNYDKADFVFYLPLDTAFNAKKFVRVVNPKLALFAKYEFWHHFLKELENKKIPSICFSAIFRQDQVFFKPYGSFFKVMLQKFDRIFVQDIASENLLKNIGINKTELTGDTRFDRVVQISNAKKQIPVVEKFKGSEKILVAGSTWPEDMKVLLPVINDPNIKIKTIIAPHEISEKALLAIEQKLEKSHIRYSKASDANLSKTEVLLIDNIGMLSSLYQYGYLAYIGGAFRKGLHNILEPACFGLPVFFGPNYSKFREAVELYKSGAAFPIESTEELRKQFISLIENEPNHFQLSAKIRSYVENNTGATQKIFNYCQTILK